MIVAVISDIHANVTALQLVLDDISKKSISRIYCLGDLVGFHTSPGECLDLLQQYKVECIAGNHDSGVTGKLGPNKFPRECWEAIEWTRTRLSQQQMSYLNSLPTQMLIEKQFRLMHGIFGDVHHYLVGTLKLCYVAARLRATGFALAFYGHTHQQKCDAFRNGLLAFQAYDQPTNVEVAFADHVTYLINPGTVGQPRTRDTDARYCVLDTDRRTVSFAHIPYDYSAVMKRTLAMFPTHEAFYARFASALPEFQGC